MLMTPQRTINLAVFAEFPIVETERFVLSRYDVDNQSDRETVFSLRSHPEVTKYMDRDPMKDIAEVPDLIGNFDKMFADQSSIQWAIRLKETGSSIGTFCFWNIRPSHCRAEIGYSVLYEHWRTGVMYEVGQRMLRFGAEQMQLHTVDAIINPKNDASRQLLLRLGFEKEAYHRQDYQYNGKFLDSEVYGIVLGV
jgi:[ribosomal protein S5]-alanine N-acetyltransferase